MAQKTMLKSSAYSFDSLSSNSMKSSNPKSGCRKVDVARTIDTTIPDPSKNQGVVAIMDNIDVYDMTHADEVMRKMNGEKVNTLNSRMGTGGNQVPVLHNMQSKNSEKIQGTRESIAESTGTSTYSAVLRMRSGKPGGGKGALVSTEKSLTLATNNDQTVFSQVKIFDMTHANNPVQSYNGEKCHTLTSRMGTGGNQVPVLHNMQSKTVRRLTPTECERLQGLPDGYTNIEFDGKPSSDSRRYKAIGNGMAQPCADFVVAGIVRAMEEEKK